MQFIIHSSNMATRPINITVAEIVFARLYRDKFSSQEAESTSYIYSGWAKRFKSYIQSYNES